MWQILGRLRNWSDLVCRNVYSENSLGLGDGWEAKEFSRLPVLYLILK